MSTVTARVLERPSFLEVHLTARTGGGPGAVGALFASLAAEVAERRLLPLGEKIYGGREHHAALVQARDQAYDLLGVPAVPVPTVLEGRPPGGAAGGAVQLWGVVPRPGASVVVTDVAAGDASPGRLLTLGDAQLLVLPSIPGGPPGAPRDAQASAMLDRAQAALRAVGFGFGEVARTWIYLAELLGWYDAFNRVRTARYAAFGVGPGTAHPAFPASTGIEGRLGDEACFMDLLAVKPGASGRLRVVPIAESPRQGPAVLYGSAFSRACALLCEGRKTVFASGTAAIDHLGRTTSVGSAEGQVLDTLVNLGALLDAQGSGLDRVASAVVYCKDDQAVAAYRYATRVLRIPELPAVVVLADVCRPELLIEIEAIAFA